MVPFNRACLTGKELEYIKEAVENGHISGNGPFTRKCERLLEEATGAKRALLTTSCTDALEMTGLLLNLRPGDEVIVPSFTFVSTANAYALRNAQLVFADIREDTLNLDESKLEALITRRTRAIVVVHYAGVACDMDAILAIAGKYGIAVVEDNAHGLFGAYKGNPLGSLGRFATLSFHETKNITCGEGGALLLNREEDCERAEILREKGTNRSRFFRGQVDKYTWVDVGSSFLPSDLVAAFLLSQLETARRIQAERSRVWNHYERSLRGWAEANGVRMPYVPAYARQSFHMFYLLLPSLEDRQSFITHMKDRGFGCVFHYLPLHLSDMGRAFGGREGACPVTERVSDRLVRLPFFSSLETETLKSIAEAAMAFRVGRPRTAAVAAAATGEEEAQVAGLRK